MPQNTCLSKLYFTILFFISRDKRYRDDDDLACDGQDDYRRYTRKYFLWRAYNTYNNNNTMYRLYCRTLLDDYCLIDDAMRLLISSDRCMAMLAWPCWYQLKRWLTPAAT